MVKTICIKILLLTLILVGLNFIYAHTFYSKDLTEKSKEMLDIKAAQEDADIFYFGESSNITFTPEDSIKNSISEITNFFFPSLKIKAINKYATHGGIYKYWLKEIDPQKRLPAAVIITLNLRSFDATWIHSELETPLQESLVLTKPYPAIVNRFFLSLQAFDNKTAQQREKEMLHEWRTKQLEFPAPFRYKTTMEWDNGMAEGGYKKEDGSWDMEKITLACHYIKGYAFNLDEDNPRVKDFDEIVSWCNKRKVNLYLNLMAENIEYADSLVGKELVFLMKQNRDYLVERYSKGNCKVVDNMELVPGKRFIDQTWTTEHYDYRGRMIIAKNLATKLKDQFKNEYKPVY